MSIGTAYHVFSFFITVLAVIGVLFVSSKCIGDHRFSRQTQSWRLETLIDSAMTIKKLAKRRNLLV